ncbi:hypothetical protein [Bradyrhizobium sp. DASA03120]|uniref:hypothetical protein n=1 Tax=Bradyrhizobium sp. SMVTL-02 TaxID=3395917 RepID=UPI003F7168B5
MPAAPIAILKPVLLVWCMVLLAIMMPALTMMIVVMPTMATIMPTSSSTMRTIIIMVPPMIAAGYAGFVLVASGR